jgi:hypothetical protein
VSGAVAGSPSLETVPCRGQRCDCEAYQLSGGKTESIHAKDWIQKEGDSIRKAVQGMTKQEGANAFAMTQLRSLLNEKKA